MPARSEPLARTTGNQEGSSGRPRSWSRDRKGAVARERDDWLPTLATAPFRSRLQALPLSQILPCLHRK